MPAGEEAAFGSASKWPRTATRMARAEDWAPARPRSSRSTHLSENEDNAGARLDRRSARADGRRHERKCQALGLYRLPAATGRLARRNVARAGKFSDSASHAALCQTPIDLVSQRARGSLARGVR